MHWTGIYLVVKLNRWLIWTQMSNWIPKKWRYWDLLLRKGNVRPVVQLYRHCHHAFLIYTKTLFSYLPFMYSQVYLTKYMHVAFFHPQQWYPSYSMVKKLSRSSHSKTIASKWRHKTLNSFYSFRSNMYKNTYVIHHNTISKCCNRVKLLKKWNKISLCFAFDFYIYLRKQEWHVLTYFKDKEQLSAKVSGRLH